MKSRLLLLLSLATLSMNSQTTHNLDWFAGIGSSVDLAIETGDTVIWTWTSPNHTVENVPGNSVETFNSGQLIPNGSTFEWTFTVVGDNDYFCGIHGAISMSGTITVQDNLGIDDESLSSFKVIFNSSENHLKLKLSNNVSDGIVTIYDMLGKRSISQGFMNKNTVDLNVASLNDGIYIVTIESNNLKQTKRFLKF